MSMMLRRRKPSFKVPNRLIMDGTLSFSARRVGVVLYSRRNRLGSCKRSLLYLSKQAHCSVTTVRKAIEELEDAKYITRTKNHRFSFSKGRLVYDQYTYHCVLGTQRDFTFIPWDLFGLCLKSCAFVLCLYLYQQAGNTTRAFPSLNRICRDVGMSIATVCRALNMLESVGRIYAQFCIKTNRSFSNNSYFFLLSLPTAPAALHHLDISVQRYIPGQTHLRSDRMRIAVGTAPFPRYNYMPAKGMPQGFSSGGGTLKTGKLVIRLR